MKNTMTVNREEYIAAYHSAIAADCEFTHAVARQFSARTAGDMRYFTELFNPETRAAYEAKVAADKHMHACIEASRTGLVA